VGKFNELKGANLAECFVPTEDPCNAIIVPVLAEIKTRIIEIEDRINAIGGLEPKLDPILQLRVDILTHRKSFEHLPYHERCLQELNDGDSFVRFSSEGQQITFTRIGTKCKISTTNDGTVIYDYGKALGLLKSIDPKND
jgi:hypothetical protein